MVPVTEVLYLEAADKYVRVLTARQEYLIRTPLKELAAQLDPAVFWQVHRGTVVQARCIASARREESGKVTLSAERDWYLRGGRITLDDTVVTGDLAAVMAELAKINAKLDRLANVTVTFGQGD